MQTKSQLTIDGKKPFREFVLDEPEPPLPVSYLKSGLFSRVFYGLINPIKEILLKSLFISIASISFFETFHLIKENIRKKNQNLSNFMNTLVGIGLFIAECVAITAAVAGVLGGLILAPKIFMAITGFKTLQSLTGMAHHLYHIGKNYLNKYFNQDDETFTYAHASHVKAFKNHAMGFVLNSTLLLGVTFGFFIPAVYPTLLTSTAIVKAALAVKWTVVGIYGSAAVVGLAPTLFSGLKSVCNFIKNKIKPTPKPLDSLEESLLDEQEERVKMYSNNLDPAQQALYLQANRFDNLSETHIDDLLVKIEVLSHNGSRNPFYHSKSVLLQLIDQEAENIKNGNGSKPIAENIKFIVIQQMRTLIDGGKLHLRYNGASYDNTIFGLVRYYHDRGQFSDVVKSRFKTQGGMQKLLVVAHHYFELNPSLIGEPTLREEINVENTYNNKSMQRLGMKKHKSATIQRHVTGPEVSVTSIPARSKHAIASNNTPLPQPTEEMRREMKR